MGYTTDFEGEFKFNRSLTIAEKNELDEISEKDWRDDNSRPDYHSYYCQWATNEEGTALGWDGNEKFYGYIEWLEWLIDNFFEPKGIKLNGEIFWYGENPHDIGILVVKDNILEVKNGKITY